MEALHSFSHLLQIPTSSKCFRTMIIPFFRSKSLPNLHHNSSFSHSEHSPSPTNVTSITSPNWLRKFRKKKSELPRIVKAGYPCLHEPARDVSPDEVGLESTQKLIDNMIQVMRIAPGVGLAAPQIGVPLKIIVLEDREEYMSDVPKEEVEAQDRRPFDLLVILNPRLRTKGDKTAIFFEGCLSVDGFAAMVERHIDVEVTGKDRNGLPMKVDASGWQARILQHECDHLNGTLYVDKMVPRTFTAIDNYDLRAVPGCPNVDIQ